MASEEAVELLFVQTKHQADLRTSFWHLYLQEWREVYDVAKFPKSDCQGKSRLDKMMRVLKPPEKEKKSSLHDIEKWEYAIMVVNQE